MKYSKEVAQQVIRNIELIEQSYKVVEDVQDVIFGAMAKVCENHLKKSSLDLTDDACFDLGKGDFNATFTVKKWCDLEGGSLATYYIAHDENKQSYEAEIHYLLPHLIGVGASTACYQIQFWLEKNLLNIKNSQYKKLLKLAFDEMTKLQQLGFRLSDGGCEVVYEFTLEQELVTNEYPDFVDSFSPFTDALDCLLDAHHLFEELVDKVKAQAELINADKK